MNPIELFRLVIQNRIVYGPGRGLGQAGTYLVTRGPGVLGYSGPLSFHCSSWTNFVLALFTGLAPDQYTHRGSMISLFELTEKTGRFRWNPVSNGKALLARPVDIQPYGDSCTRLDVDSYGALAGAMSPGELVVLGESTRLRSGKWKWWHHTAALFMSCDGTLYRCAADGYRGKSGYSHTPMDVEVLTPGLLAKMDKTKKVRAYRVDWSPCQSPVDFES